MQLLIETVVELVILVQLLVVLILVLVIAFALLYVYISTGLLRCIFELLRNFTISRTQQSSDVLIWL